MDCCRLTTRAADVWSLWLREPCFRVEDQEDHTSLTGPIQVLSLEASKEDVEMEEPKEPKEPEESKEPTDIKMDVEAPKNEEQPQVPQTPPPEETKNEDYLIISPSTDTFSKRLSILTTNSSPSATSVTSAPPNEPELLLLNETDSEDDELLQTHTTRLSIIHERIEEEEQESHPEGLSSPPAPEASPKNIPPFTLMNTLQPSARRLSEPLPNSLPPPPHRLSLPATLSAVSLDQSRLSSCLSPPVSPLPDPTPTSQRSSPIQAQKRPYEPDSPSPHPVLKQEGPQHTSQLLEESLNSSFYSILNQSMTATHIQTETNPANTQRAMFDQILTVFKNSTREVQYSICNDYLQSIYSILKRCTAMVDSLDADSIQLLFQILYTNIDAIQEQSQV